jgi:hypothetical protein
MRLLAPIKCKQMNERQKIRWALQHARSTNLGPNEEGLKVSDEEKKKRAEQQITDELANQATTEPGSPEENDSKERRAQAEKDHREAQDATSH